MLQITVAFRRLLVHLQQLQNMACLKFAVLVALAAVAQAVYVPAPLAPKAVPEPFDPHPQYSFGYTVQDPLTGDTKSQQEVRDGDVVQGSYSLVEPDGNLRTVTYSADPVSGFNAVVDRQHGAVSPISAPVAVKAAPIAVKPAPVAVRTAPIAPAYHYGYPGYYRGVNHGYYGGVAPGYYGGVGHGYYGGVVPNTYSSFASPYTSYIH